MIIATRKPSEIIAEQTIGLIASNGHKTYRIQTEGYAVTLTFAEAKYLISLVVQSPAWRCLAAPALALRAEPLSGVSAVPASIRIAGGAK